MLFYKQKKLKTVCGGIFARTVLIVIGLTLMALFISLYLVRNNVRAVLMN